MADTNPVEHGKDTEPWPDNGKELQTAGTKRRRELMAALHLTLASACKEPDTEDGRADCRLLAKITRTLNSEFGLKVSYDEDRLNGPLARNTAAKKAISYFQSLTRLTADNTRLVYDVWKKMILPVLHDGLKAQTEGRVLSKDQQRTIDVIQRAWAMVDVKAKQRKRQVRSHEPGVTFPSFWPLKFSGPAFSQEGADLIFDELLAPVLEDHWDALSPNYPKLTCGKVRGKTEKKTFCTYRFHLYQSWRTWANRHQGDFEGYELPL